MGGYPALAIQQPEGPLKEIGQLEQIKGEQQRQQLGAIQLQQARVAADSRQALMAAWAKNGGDLNKTLADATHSGKVTPEDLMGFQTHAVDLQVKAAQLTKEQLANEEKTNDIFANTLESFRQLPVEQRTPDAVKATMATLANQGVDISKYVPMFQQLAQAPNDETIKSLELSLKGRQWVTENEKAQRGLASMPTVEQAQQKNLAELTKVQAEALKTQREYEDLPDASEARTERAAKLLQTKAATAKDLAETAKTKAETALAQLSPVEGTDPTTGQRVVVSRNDVRAKGLTQVTPLTSEQFGKESMLSARFSQVAQVTGKYESALKSLDLNPAHEDDIAQVISDQNLGNNPGHVLGLIPSSSLVASKEVTKATADAWNNLNPSEREAARQYLLMKGNTITYNKAVDDTGRTSETALALEVASIPTPLEAKDKNLALQRLQGTKDNIRSILPAIPKFDHLKNPIDYLESAEQTPLVANTPVPSGWDRKAQFSPK